MENYHVIWDFREIRLDISIKQVMMHPSDFTKLTQIRTNFKTAIVVNNMLNLGIVRSYQNMSIGERELEIETFSNINDAENWIKSS